MQGIDDYSFEEKNRWRVMMWHRVTARLKRWHVSVPEALVIYLSGEQDLDRKVALKKGFSWDNLISIEKDKTKVKALRDRHVNTIHGDIAHVLLEWTHEKQPGVVYADLCSNLSRNVVIKFIDSLWGGTPLAKNCVVVLNFQRGREHENIVAQFLEDDEEFADQFARDFGVDKKHRGMQFLVAMVSYFQLLNKEAKEKGLASAFTGISGENETDLCVNVLKSLNPECLSYRGNNVWMDSVVFTWAFSAGEKIRDRVDKKVKNKIIRRRTARVTAACMATRTRSIS